MAKCNHICGWSDSFAECKKPEDKVCPMSNVNRPKASKVYRKKPVVIEAIRWTGDNFADVQRFAGDAAVESVFCEDVLIQTLEGIMRASVGDYIIKGVKGEFYPCKPDIFEQTYDEVQDG